jgi:uncharacterized membrane protein
MGRNGELSVVLGIVIMLVFAHLGIMQLVTVHPYDGGSPPEGCSENSAPSFVILIPPVISTTISTIVVLITLAFNTEVDICAHAAAMPLVTALIYDVIVLARFFQCSSAIGWLMVCIAASYVFPLLFLFNLIKGERENSEIELNEKKEVES